MEKMTIERAKGLVFKCEHAPSREAMDRFMANNRDWYFMAKGFIEGHESRQAEVEKLTKKLNFGKQSLKNT